ncbi:MAG: isochorismatase family protein, partial [Planctomycetaceae bacterium]|nr:isochorismatase family protein [Planctomycetaceae bacterium]
EKNHFAGRHTREVIDPFLKRMRKNKSLVMYSLIGDVDPIRKKLYRTFNYNPSQAEREQARQELTKQLKTLRYQGKPLPDQLILSKEFPVIDYFKQFSGLSASDHFNGTGFWNVPVPITRDITVQHDDVLIFDREGYEPLKRFLKNQGIRHILLTGYATDMCFCKTTAGYENLSRDFNVFLVGDATLATFPANSSPKYATNAHISFASLNHLITQVSWVKQLSAD